MTTSPVAAENRDASALPSAGARRLRVVAEPRRVDPAAAQVAARALLTALGVSMDTEGMLDTPRRMVDAYLRSILRRWLLPAVIVAIVALVIVLLPPAFAGFQDNPTSGHGHEATAGPSPTPDTS